MTSAGQVRVVMAVSILVTAAGSVIQWEPVKLMPYTLDHGKHLLIDRAI